MILIGPSAGLQQWALVYGQANAVAQRKSAGGDEESYEAIGIQLGATSTSACRSCVRSCRPRHGDGHCHNRIAALDHATRSPIR